MTNLKLSAREFVEMAPEGTLFNRDAVLELLENAGEIAEGSPGQVAKILGRSAKYWRMVASEINGSYREGERWRLPLSACRAHLLRKSASREGPRGPYKAKAAQAKRAGTKSLPARPQLLGGSEALPWQKDRAERSASSRLAAGGGAD